FATGNHTIGFNYSGDVNYNYFLESQGVPSGNPTSIYAKYSTTSAVISTPPSPITYGTPVTFTGMISGTGTVDGTANFVDSAGAWPGGGNTNLTVTSGTVTQTPTALFSAGTHGITLQYLGSSSYYSSTSPVYSLQVNPATPTIALTSTSVTGLSLG